MGMCLCVGVCGWCGGVMGVCLCGGGGEVVCAFCT